MGIINQLLTQKVMKIGICVYCKKEIDVDTTIGGTDGLINHLNRCNLYIPIIALKKSRAIKQSRLIIKTNEHGKSTIMNWKYNQNAITRMIIIDELPFRFVENEWFGQLMVVVFPNYKHFSWQTIGRDCFELYLHEIYVMKSFFKIHVK